MSDLAYPTGCRPLTEDLGTDELIRRLKTLAHTLQAMGQDDGMYQPYIPLALHLVEDTLLQHTSRDVQLLVACCIADMLRVYAPEAPYKDQEQIKTIFMFFIKQLYGLKDPKDPSFKRYFYLLENLAYVKSFNMCFEIEECHKIFCQLFAMMFKIINEEHSSKVKNFIIDILSPLITEADNFTTELLDLILINIVEPQKTQNKNAYHLAEQLITKTSDSLEPVIKMFFNQVLIMDKLDKNLAISAKIYDLIYELHLISPNVLCSVLPQLECKLKSTNEAERLKAVSLLARMFSEKDSPLSKKHPALLRMFLGRFCDIAVAIRVKCVQSSMHFLLNQAHLRQDVIDCLRARQHDSEETVRYEVVMAIVETAKRDFMIVCESEDLLDFVRERTLDKKFKIRKEAMNGLAFIYKQAMCEPNTLSLQLKKSIDRIKNKVLHGYYMPGMEDRLLVERLLITCLVPYKLPAVERMKKLYHLLGTLDDNATRAFVELQKNQMKTRKTVSDWVKLHHNREVTPKMQNQLNLKQAAVCRLLPDPLKATEYITQFSANMRKDANLLRCMEIILKRDVSCKECADTMSMLLKKLGTPIMTNLYYNTVKMLIERVASVMVDKESVGILIGLIEDCMQRGKTVDEVGIPRSEAGERGLRLLSVLSYVFSAHFFTDATLRHMIALLSCNEDYAAPLVLKSLTHLGRYKPLADNNPVILDELAPICKEFALVGTPKQAKHAVRCIFTNTQPCGSLAVSGGGPSGGGSATTTSQAAVGTGGGYDHDLVSVGGGAGGGGVIVHPIFNEVMDTLRATLTPRCEYQRTKIVSLGHIAFNMAKAFQTPIKNMIARRIVKELLIQGVAETRDCTLPTGDWCDEEDLPEDTLCKVDALKTMARWLLGLRSDEHAAQKTFRMLTAFVNQRGDLFEQNRLCAAEKSWLRLAAACAMLKISEQNGVGDQFSGEQFLSLSQVMFDPVVEVRERFARKLHKGLGKGLPKKCLPLDFMGFYALAGHETDKKLAEAIRHYVETDVNRRREYLKNVSATTAETLSSSETLFLVPDYMLAFAIPVLVHDPAYTSHENRAQLRAVERCLRFILDPLMARRDAFSYSFYMSLIQMMKNHEMISAAIAGSEEESACNFKMWAACDLALHIINSKLSDGVTDGNRFEQNIQLPKMYFKASASDVPNTRIYIPLDTYTLTSSSALTKKAAPKLTSSAATTTTTTTGTTAMTTAIKRPTAAGGDEQHHNNKSNSAAAAIHENSLRNVQKKNAAIFDDIRAESTSEPKAKRTRAELATKS